MTDWGIWKVSKKGQGVNEWAKNWVNKLTIDLLSIYAWVNE